MKSVAAVKSKAAAPSNPLGQAGEEERRKFVSHLYKLKIKLSINLLIFH